MIKSDETNEYICDFTEAQAISVNTTLESDGIGIESAIKLIDHWNQLGKQHNDIQYHYSLKTK